MTIPVFYNKDNLIEITPDWYDRPKSNALSAKRKRSPSCLHHNDEDLLHEMIIVFHRDAVSWPHRHLGKTEWYHVLFGELDIVLFDNAGRATRIISMGDLASGKTLVYRQSTPYGTVSLLSPNTPRSTRSRKPFRVEENDFAPWSPEVDDELRAFLKVSVGAFLRRCHRAPTPV
jgi:cupin fold WbuC family metalloprotein